MALPALALILGVPAVAAAGKLLYNYLNPNLRDSTYGQSDYDF